MSYHIMLTMKSTNLHGKLETLVQVMDFSGARIIRFTLDELEKDEMPDELKEYIRGILPDIEDGRWHYSGEYYK